MHSNLNKIVQLLGDILQILDSMKGLHEEKYETHPLLDKYQVMRKLQISDTTYRRHIKKGLLRPRRIGGTDYFYERDIVDALEESRRKGRI